MPRRSSAPRNGQMGPPVANRPYGAATLEATDRQALTLSLAEQIHGLGPVDPKMSLFPASTARDSAGTFIPNNPNRQARIIGLSPADMETIAHKLSAPLYGGTHCSSTNLERGGHGDYTATALHETTHYIADRLGLDQKTFAAAQAKAPSIYLENIKERIADASAILYMYSNYGSAADVAHEKTYRSAIRDALVRDPMHTTSTSMDAAEQYFRAHPARGMSIVQTTQLAARIVATQPAAQLSLAPQEQAFSIMDGGGVRDASTQKAAIDVLRRAQSARNQVCKL